MCVSRPEVKSLFSKTISFSAAVGSRVLAACWPDCESLSKRCGIIHLTGRVGSPQTVPGCSVGDNMPCSLQRPTVGP